MLTNCDIQATKFKQIQDFKVRVLDFVGIYVKEMKKKETTNRSKALDSMDLIKGLLKGLQAAHSDQNMILFERIKAVISMMAKGTQDQQKEDGESSSIKQNKIIMTELMSQMLKHSKDQQMLKAYQDCFMFLTKHFYQSGNKKLQKFLVFTYKELLKKFLSGRTSSTILSVRFFQAAFEQNPSFGWNFAKLLLKCIAQIKSKEKVEEGKVAAAGSESEGVDANGSRSNFQRLQALELFAILIKDANQNE